MRVDTNPYLARTAAAAGAASSTQSTDPRARFRLDEDRGKAAGSGAPRSVATLDTMTAIIALQEETGEGGSERRQRRAQRGRDLLDTLDRLKAALLAGRLSPADLGRLKSLLGQAGGTTGDPELDAVMAQIELRAAVEIAKLQAAGIGC